MSSPKFAVQEKVYLESDNKQYVVSSILHSIDPSVPHLYNLAGGFTWVIESRLSKEPYDEQDNES